MPAEDLAAVLGAGHRIARTEAELVRDVNLERIVRPGGHDMHVAIERGERHLEIAATDQCLDGGTGGGQRRDHLVPATAAIDAIGHGHAFGGVGQHDHGAQLRRLPRGDHGRPRQAGKQGEECPQSQQHEQGQPAPRHARAIGRHGHEHGHEQRRHQGHERPRPHRVELHGDLFEGSRIGHASPCRTGGSGGPEGSGDAGSGSGSAASANVAAAPGAASAPSRGA
ncbi:MAG: hypothetical protein EBR23_14245 [Planctomycetia bacterium]|nr:hypothetical protein [Planctomycetia bacterium]